MMIDRTDHIPDCEVLDNDVDLNADARNADARKEVLRREFAEFWEDVAPDMMRHSADHVGETFMRVWSRWADLRCQSPDVQRAFAYRALRYARLDGIRHDAYRRREVAADSVPDHSVEEAGYEAALSDLTLAKLMGPLSLREREIMVRVVQGHTTEEIAVDLGLSVNTVYALRARARSRLKKLAPLRDADTDR